MYPWPIGDFDNAMDVALETAMDYLEHTGQATEFPGSPAGRSNRNRGGMENRREKPDQAGQHRDSDGRTRPSHRALRMNAMIRTDRNCPGPALDRAGGDRKRSRSVAAAPSISRRSPAPIRRAAPSSRRSATTKHEPHLLVGVGGSYRDYCDVPAATFDAFMTAPSMGHFYRQSIATSDVDGPFNCFSPRTSQK